MQEVYEFLKKVNTYYLATVDGDQPRVRPFGTIDMFDGRLYIQTGKSKDVAKQIAANPKIEICAFDPAESKWLRIEAVAEEDPRREARKHMLDAYPSLRGRYSEDDGNTLALYLKDVTATIAGFSSEARTIKF